MAGKTCNGCNEQAAAYDMALAFAERTTKRLWIVILVLIGLLFATNLAWVLYESQFEVIETSIEVEQQNDSGDNNFIGNDGDIIYGDTESKNND